MDLHSAMKSVGRSKRGGGAAMLLQTGATQNAMQQLSVIPQMPAMPQMTMSGDKQANDDDAQVASLLNQVSQLSGKQVGSIPPPNFLQLATSSSKQRLRGKATAQVNQEDTRRIRQALAAMEEDFAQFQEHGESRDAKDQLKASQERVALAESELQTAETLKHNLTDAVAEAYTRRSRFIDLAQSLQMVYQESISELQQTVIPKLVGLDGESAPRTALLDDLQRDSVTLTATTKHWTSRVKEANARDENAASELDRVRESKESELEARKENAANSEMKEKRLAMDPKTAKKCEEARKRVALLDAMNKG